MGKTRSGAFLSVALIAGLLIPTRAHAAEPPVVNATLSVERGCDGANAGTSLLFGEAVTPGATLVSAQLDQMDADGQTFAGFVDDVGANVEIDPDGTVSGSYPAPEPHPRAEGYRFLLTVTKDGLETTGASQLLPTDMVEPRITMAAVIDQRTLRVTFSEPVTVEGGDAGIDWLVDGQRPISVTGQDDVRFLQMTSDLGEDATPQVKYYPQFRSVYKDCVGRPVAGDGRTQTALDRIVPSVPVIDTIDGKDAADGFVASTNTSAPVTVTAVTNKHTVTLWQESGTVAGFDDTDAFLGDEIGGGGPVTIPTGTLADNTNHVLYATATDPSGNHSNGADVVTFRTDNIAPTATAAQTTGQKVTVVFDEAVTEGRNDPADWRITVGGVPATITSVTGGGEVRILNTSAVVPNGSSVEYLGTAGYKDEAGNELGPFGGVTATGFVATVLDLVPETATLAVQGSHGLTATVLDDNGNPVPGSLVVVRGISGPASKKAATGEQPAGFVGQCFSGQNGTCDIPNYSSNEVGLDRLQGWLDTDQNPMTIEAAAAEARDADDGGSPAGNIKNQDVVEANWVAEGVDLVLDVAETASSVPAEQQMSIAGTVSALDDLGSSGTKIAGVTLAAKVTAGPHLGRPLESCKTNATGTCNLTYTGASAGVDTIQVWIDRDENKNNNETSSVESFDADGTPVFDDPEQDVVRRTWLTKALPVLDMSPGENTRSTGTTELFSLLTIDTTGKALAGLNLDLRVVSGPNAGKYIGECTTATNGRCSLSYTSTIAGTDIVQAWIDADGNDIANEATIAEAPNQATSGDENDQDMSRIVWTGASASAPPSPSASGSPSPSASPTGSPSPSASPGSGSQAALSSTDPGTGTVGGCHQVEVVLTRDGGPVVGANIDAEPLNDAMSFCGGPAGHAETTTDSNGRAVFALTSSEPGQFELLTWHDAKDNDTLDLGEAEKRMMLSWEIDHSRTISLTAKKKVKKGRRVWMRGIIEAANTSCASKRNVKIVRKRAGKARLLKLVRTDAVGTFVARVRVRKTARYFARVTSGGCEAARSPAIRIRAIR